MKSLIDRIKKLNKRGKILLGVGVVLVLLLVTAGGFALLAPVQTAMLTHMLFGTAATDIEPRFDAIDEDGGKPLAFIFGKDASGNYIGDDATLSNHYQGIQRKDYMGFPYFLITRNADGAGELLVVKMGSKQVSFLNLMGYPLNTNRANSTGNPDSRDKTVKSYHFNGQNGWPNCHHPGSGQIVGNVMVVPVEGGCTRGIVLLDVTNPENITPIKHITTYTQNGTSVSFPDDMSSVIGAIQQSSAFGSKILFTFPSYPYDGGKALRFLEANSATLDANTTLTYLSTWNRDNLQNDVSCGTLIKCGRFRCGRDCASLTVNWQTLNFVNNSDGTLYLIGMDSDAEVVHDGGSSGADYARLFKLVRSGNSFTITFIHQRHIISDKPTKMGNWNAGSGVSVSPMGQLMLYMTNHDNKGPTVDGRETIQAGEWWY